MSCFQAKIYIGDIDNDEILYFITHLGQYKYG